MASDIATVVKYLGHTHIAIKSIVTGEQGAQEGHFEGTRINRAEDFVSLRNGKRQLWINLQKLKPEVGKYISFLDIESYTNVYIDLDCVKPDDMKDYAATEEERAVALSSLPLLKQWLSAHELRCGLELSTGNGAGMVLPIPATKAEPVFIAKLATFLKKIKADIPNADAAMFDPPRVIGIPGTINAKLETDTRKNQVREIVGDVPARVEDQALLSYINSMEPDPDALKKWSTAYKEPQATTSPTTPPGTNDTQVNANAIMARLNSLLALHTSLGDKLDGKGAEKDRSKAEYQVCGSLINAGFTDPEIDYIMQNVSKIGKWQEEGDHYRFEQTLRKLRESEAAKEEEPHTLEISEALLLIADLREKVKKDPGAPFEPKFVEAIAVIKISNQPEYARLMADLKGKTAIQDLKKAVKECVVKIARQKGAARKKALEGINIEDVANVGYDDCGNVKGWALAPTRAAATILKALPLVMTKDDDAIYHFGGQIYEPDGARIIDVALIKAAGDAVDIKELKEVLRRIRNCLLDSPVALDPNPYLLGCKNGVVDLTTGEFRDYLPEDLITDQIPVTYDAEAKCPVFLSFLESITPSESDRITLIDWMAATAIREAFAYVLFLLGLGRNGKGIYERLLKRIFKDSAFSEMKLSETEKSTFAAEYLYGKRGWIAAETGNKKAKINTDFLKLTSGSNGIDADRKNKSRIRFDPFFKATVDTNNMPQIMDASRGWQERFVKIDLPYTFIPNPDPNNPLEKEADQELFEKLTTETELSGILNLIIFRAKAIGKTRRIHKRPAAEMFAEYQEQSASVHTFLNEFCTWDSDGMTSMVWMASEPVYDLYREWCGYKVGEVVDSRPFGKILKRFCGGLEPKRGKTKGKDRKSTTEYKGLNFDSTRCKMVIEELKKGVSIGLYKSQSMSLLENDQQITMSLLSQCNSWKEIYENFNSFSIEDKISPIREETSKIIETIETIETSVAGGAVVEGTPLEDVDRIETNRILIETNQKIRIAAMSEYGISGWVDPAKIAAKLHIELEEVTSWLEAQSNYVRTPSGNGYTQRSKAESA